MKKSFLSAALALLLCAAMTVCGFAAQTGDVNGDGKINSADARTTLLASARVVALDREQSLRADIDGNGRINAADARFILRIAAKLEISPDDEEYVTIPAEETTAAPTTEEQTTEAPELPQALTPRDIYEQAKEFTVEINVEGFDPLEETYFTATGSGFFISEDGLIITNYHVIDGAETVTVVTPDGKEHKATKLLAYDRIADLALIKAKGIKHAVAAPVNTEELNTGDSVFALGSAQGLTNTFSHGMISQPGRVVPEYNEEIPYIQVDMAINNGNSGGPLLNERGEVIGINTWGLDDAESLNFSIPISCIDDLYLGDPISFKNFDGGMDLPVSSKPGAPLFIGTLQQDELTARIRPNGTAGVFFEFAPTPDAERIAMQELVIDGLPDGAEYTVSDWLFGGDEEYGNLAPFVFVTITASEPVDAAQITISPEKMPELRATLTLTVEEDAPETYFGFSSVPDFGLVTGKTDFDFEMLVLMFGFGPNFTYEDVTEEELQTYIDALEAAGYEYSESGDYTIYDEETDEETVVGTYYLYYNDDMESVEVDVIDGDGKTFGVEVFFSDFFETEEMEETLEPEEEVFRK